MTLEEKQNALAELHSIINETRRLKEVCHNADIIIDKIDKEFKDITSFDGKDWMFLCFATALQIIRQYWITRFEEKRLSDQEAAKETWGHKEEHTARYHKWYRPSIEEITNNPVPFDATFGSNEIGLGLGGKTHRYKTLGHDPFFRILVWHDEYINKYIDFMEFRILSYRNRVN